MPSFLKYIVKYVLLTLLCPLIPHPRMRSAYLKLLGARIGRNARIENAHFIQVQHPISNLNIGHDVFIGANVAIDLSEAINIGPGAAISPGCSLITHQDAGTFNKTKLSALYPQQYLPITIEDNVWIGCDTTVLPGAHIGPMTVIGAKSLVRGSIPGWVMAAGIPATVRKKLRGIEQK
ncbi:MAG: acyltransferase [Deltaproteobacteria bacterium]|nr:acyltransferase [Deltaproteobacteria bacterium]